MFLDYRIAAPTLEARMTMLFRSMATVEETLNTNMKISKNMGMNIIKNLRIQNLEKR